MTCFCWCVVWTDICLRYLTINLEAVFFSEKKKKKSQSAQYLHFISGAHESSPHENETKTHQIDVELSWWWLIVVWWYVDCKDCSSWLGLDDYRQRIIHKIIKFNFNMLVQKASASHFMYFHFNLTKAKKNILLLEGRNNWIPSRAPYSTWLCWGQTPFL